MTDSGCSRLDTKSGTEWFGERYPTWHDLETLAEAHGCLVVMSLGRVPAFHPGTLDVGPSIFIPKESGALERMWTLAHELGHLVNHRGYINDLSYDRQEAQARRWAAAALIPLARINAYGNASLDAFMGALSAHYEDLPYEDCPARRLAADIALVRLSMLEAA